mmetsp:Transcript_34128/g.62445  ORF Transcript_34128/g.62445 Transcript_34128/m.62445 type:complete len:95 (-) Transcript_34128:1084-1368(-)
MRLGEDSYANCPKGTGGAVDSYGTDRVIYVHAVYQLLGYEGNESCKETDQHGHSWSNDMTACTACDKTCKNSSDKVRYVPAGYPGLHSTPKDAS